MKGHFGMIPLINHDSRLRDRARSSNNLPRLWTIPDDQMTFLFIVDQWEITWHNLMFKQFLYNTLPFFIPQNNLVYVFLYIYIYFYTFHTLPYNAIYKNNMCVTNSLTFSSTPKHICCGSILRIIKKRLKTVRNNDSGSRGRINWCLRKCGYDWICLYIYSHIVHKQYIYVYNLNHIMLIVKITPPKRNSACVIS